MKPTFLLRKTQLSPGRPQQLGGSLGLGRCRVKAKEDVTCHILQIIDRWAYWPFSLLWLLDYWEVLSASLALTSFRLPKAGNHLCS